MILNENTKAHPFYQPGRRARVPKQVPPRSKLATGDCPGDLEGALAWMRRRQEYLKKWKVTRLRGRTKRAV